MSAHVPTWSVTDADPPLSTEERETVEGAMWGCTTEADAEDAADEMIHELGYGSLTRSGNHCVAYTVAYDGHPDVSGDDIKALMYEAAPRGDAQTYDDCQLALLGGEGDRAAARMRCEAAILEARGEDGR